MKIIITGSTGIVGSQLVPKLISDGHEVSLVSFKSNEDSGVLLNISDLKNMAKKDGVFLNLGALTTGEAKDQYSISRVIMANAIAPAIIASLRKRYGVKEKFVYFSSTVVFWVGQKREGIIDEKTSIDISSRAPKASSLIKKIKDKFDEIIMPGLDSETDDFLLNFVNTLQGVLEEDILSGDESVFNNKQIYPYKLAKWIGEELLREDTNTTIIRFPTVYGPGDLHPERALPLAIKNLLTDSIATYPDSVFDYVYIQDIVDALAVFVQNPQSYPKILHLVSGHGVNSDEFIKCANSVYPNSVNKIKIFKKSTAVTPPSFSNETLKQLLGRAPTEFSAGLKAYFAWVGSLGLKKNSVESSNT